MKIKSGQMHSVGWWLGFGALCAGAYLALSAAASGSDGHKVTCGPVSAQTVVADSVARVYRVPTGQGQLGKLYDYRGCANGDPRAQLIARNASFLPGVRVYGCGGRGCRLVRRIRLKGAVAAVIVEQHGLDTIDGTLTVHDLAGARVLHTVHAGTVVGYGDTLITYVLARSGDVAWATVTTSSGARGSFHRSGTIRCVIGQVVTTLDTGPEVHASSLRLHGRTVEWIDGGRQRTASLP